MAYSSLFCLSGAGSKNSSQFSVLSSQKKQNQDPSASLPLPQPGQAGFRLRAPGSLTPAKRLKFSEKGKKEIPTRAGVRVGIM